MAAKLPNTCNAFRYDAICKAISKSVSPRTYNLSHIPTLVQGGGGGRVLVGGTVDVLHLYLCCAQML